MGDQSSCPLSPWMCACSRCCRSVAPSLTICRLQDYKKTKCQQNILITESLMTQQKLLNSLPF